MLNTLDFVVLLLAAAVVMVALFRARNLPTCSSVRSADRMR